MDAGYYGNGMLTLLGCVLYEISQDIPVDRRERIMIMWKRIHMGKLNADVHKIQKNLPALTFIEKTLFGTGDIDGESVRVLGKKLIDEMEPDFRKLLSLEDR